MNDLKDNISKDEAMKNYLSKKKKESYFHSKIQILVANIVSGALIYHVFTEPSIGFIILTIIITFFTAILDYTFYDMYIKNNNKV